MKKFLKKKKEIEDKWEHKLRTEVSAHTYDWYKKNKFELFDDVWELCRLYKKTDEFERKVKEYVEEQTKIFVDIHDLSFGDKDV